jgi:MFS transporter, FSR family, fosmidomycin resistance protein
LVPIDRDRQSGRLKAARDRFETRAIEEIAMDAKVDAPPAQAASAESTVFALLLALSFSHLLNDTVQSLLPAVYPVLKEKFSLDFGQIGLITLAFQLTASLLQPLVGLYSDKRPKPYSLAIGMGFTLGGLLLLATAHDFLGILVAAATIGIGSSVFHPEASRVARMASGGRHGLAQSLFQVGGNCGAAVGPLLAAFIVVPHGQGSVAWLCLLPLLAMCVLTGVGHWYAKQVAAIRARPKKPAAASTMTQGKIVVSVLVLMALIFSKFFYLASLNSYYTFYLIDRFGLSISTAQLFLFAFLASAALGTFFGGPLGDKIGRRYVIWASILGVLPFTLALPYANLFFTGVLTVIIGFVLSSAFAAIVVYAQELVPGRVGTVAGLFFGFAFGVAGLGAALLGAIADMTSITFVYRVCAFLPAIGLLAYFLPNTEKRV